MGRIGTAGPKSTLVGWDGEDRNLAGYPVFTPVPNLDRTYVQRLFAFPGFTD